jgi:hypothetical protein
MEPGWTLAELWKERKFRGHLRTLKEARAECEPLSSNEYFWFNYSNQGEEGPQFQFYSRDYERAIETMRSSISEAESVLETLANQGHRDSISEAESVLETIANQGHREERIDLLKGRLLPYQEHIGMFPNAKLYVAHLQTMLDSKQRGYVLRGQQQKAFNAQMAGLGIE